MSDIYPGWGKFNRMGFCRLSHWARNCPPEVGSPAQYRHRENLTESEKRNRKSWWENGSFWFSAHTCGQQQHTKSWHCEICWHDIKMLTTCENADNAQDRYCRTRTATGTYSATKATVRFFCGVSPRHSERERRCEFPQKNADISITGVLLSAFFYLGNGLC